MSSPADAPANDEVLCLLGTTGLEDFVDFVRQRTVGGRGLDKLEIADPWREAAKVYEELQKRESGVADRPLIVPLPPGLQGHVDRVVAHPAFRKTFSSVPVAFGMVELDNLIVYQTRILRSSVDRLLAGLRSPVGLSQLADVCLPLTAPETPLRLVHEDGKEFVFLADNHDGRFLGAEVLDAAGVPGLQVPGHARHVVALAFGYTTNVLNVVRYGKRMVLNNGYHRAYALRKLGVTHLPALIQVCGEWEEVGLAAGGPAYENGPFYFSSARPPLLKDFFNPELTRSYAAQGVRKQIRLTVEVDTVQLSL